MKRLLFLGSALLVTTCLVGFNFAGPQPVTVRAIRQGAAGVQVLFNVEQGYGVQREGRHKVEVVKLAPNHKKEKDMLKKSKLYGQSIGTNNHLQGQVAAQDKEYYSSLSPVVVPVKNTAGDLMVTGRLFYCSFSNKFCSVQSFAVPVD